MPQDNQNKKNFYKWVRLGGLLSIIPLILVCGPAAGYLAGDFLVKYFKLPSYVLIICVMLGLAAGLKETIRVIKISLKILNEADR